MARILIIEDDQFISDVYKELLESEGFQVVVAKDGAEGMEQLKSQMWDLLLLDIMLPKRDGLDILKELRTYHQTQQPKRVIVLTNVENEDVMKQVYQYQVDSYILKSGADPATVVGQVKQNLAA